MRNMGLTFNGIHCEYLNLHIVNKPTIPLLPEIKDQYIDIPHKDGSILIPDDSVRDIFISVDFLFTPPQGQNIYAAAIALQDWLITKDRVPLIFDFMPNIKYMGKVSGGIDNINKIAETGTFSVTFRCLPRPEVVQT